MIQVLSGIGTAVNVATVLIGSSIGLLLGARLPARTRDTVTDAPGLVTLLIGARSAAVVTSSALLAAVGSAAPVLIVLGALLLGGIAGSLLDIEARLEGFGGWLRTWAHAATVRHTPRRFSGSAAAQTRLWTRSCGDGFL